MISQVEEGIYGRKPEICHKVTFPKEEDVNLVTLDKKSLHSPLAVEVLASGEKTHLCKIVLSS